MSKYKESDYSLSYALQNIGDYFWRLYRDDLKAYAVNRVRKDIPQRQRTTQKGFRPACTVSAASFPSVRADTAPRERGFPPLCLN